MAVVDGRLITRKRRVGPSDGDVAKLWSETLGLLKTRVIREGFETWLAPTKGRTINRDVLEIEVPNTFFADWLGQHYAAEIQAALADLTGRKLSVSYRARGASSATILQRRARARTSAVVRTNGCRLQARYTFDSFIVGESNRFACAAARSVAEKPGSAYNPLFLYGGVGLGKTHLLQAIGNHALATKPDLKVLCVPAETLFLELIQAIEKNTRLEFKRRYRALNLLLLDDIHYLVGKERLQEEVFHMFNHLYDVGSQVVFTSDCPPRDLPTMEKRLASRLGSGLVVDVQAPELETRIAILMQKAATEEQALPDDVAYYIARRVKTSVRELEACLIRLLALASLTGRPITEELAEEASRDLVDTGPLVDHDSIIAAAADSFGFSVQDVKGTRRTKQLALARQVAMYLIRTMLSYSLKETGFCFGGKDHTTVMHAIDKIERLKSQDVAFAERLKKLSSGISRG